MRSQAVRPVPPRGRVTVYERHHRERWRLERQLLTERVTREHRARQPRIRDVVSSRRRIETRDWTSVDIHRRQRRSTEAILPLARPAPRPAPGASVPDTPPARSSAPTPPVALEAITDHVLRQINGRLTAQRERFGRV